MLAALEKAQALAGEGREVGYCLDHAATVHTVSRGELAARWLSKLIERERARTALASMKDGDDEAQIDGR